MQTSKEFKFFLSLSSEHLLTLKDIDGYLVQSANVDFNIIAVSESRINKNKLPPINISIPNYFYEFCPEKANAGDTLIFTRNHLSYKTRNDWESYKSCELESLFIEIFNPKKTNIIGCSYKHPSMNINEFNDDYLNKLLDKLPKENKAIFLLGDFNINLLSYHIHAPTNQFVDIISSH